MAHGLLIVDVQPAYHPGCGAIARTVAQRINNTRKPTLILWVGEGLTADSEEAVRDYLHEHGARPGKLAACQFIEKGYGFFRAWMDLGVPHDVIRRVGRQLLLDGGRCSDDLDLPALLGDEVDTLPQYDPLRTPSFDWSALRGFDRFDTCGGGAQECLAEIELLLDMADTPYQRLDPLVY